MAEEPTLGEMADKSIDKDKLIRSVLACKREAEDARRSRLEKNRQNMQIYLGDIDWSEKIDGQSTEWLPKLSIAAEQFSAFIRRGLVQFGDWFSCEVPQGSPLEPEEIVAICRSFFENLHAVENEARNIATLISDAVKLGSLESLIIVKVHGRMVEQPELQVVPGPTGFDEVTGEAMQGPPEIKSVMVKRWRLKLEIVPAQDYYPDPTGAGLYEIHVVERDLFSVVEDAEAGKYDKAEVMRMVEAMDEMERPEDEKRSEAERAQDETVKPKGRRKVVITEFWGTLLDEDTGLPLHKNCCMVIGNDQFVLKKPYPNPLWHGESPFIRVPIIRVPKSVWHKAVYDDAASLNLALVELYNLMLDGGLASVWGVRQVRTSYLEDPNDVSNGVPQGKTLAIKQETPEGMKVVETVATGEVPQEALAIFNLTDQEFNQAALTNDLKMGQLPARQVKATEIVEAQQGNANTLDSVITNLENDFIAPLIRKAFLTILQSASDIPDQELAQLVGERTAFKFLRIPPEVRFAMFARTTKFKVHGLSSTLNRVREFQKVMALSQAVATNPVLLQAFIRRFSGDKILEHMIRSLNINPEHLTLHPDEAEKFAQRFQELLMATAITQGGGQQQQPGVTTEAAGGPTVPAEVNQLVNPLTGMTG